MTSYVFEKKPVILSGMRPTEKLHIGHLEGVLREWVRFQDEYHCNFFVADYHAITTNQDTTKLRENTIDIVKDWISFGIDPKKSTIFVQSYVPQHAELHLVLSMLVHLGTLERLPTFNEYLRQIVKVDGKDEKKFDEVKRAKVNYGFLGYPVLQAADILMYKANFVPVGEDQLPHIELTRELAGRFNGIYGEIFPLPEALLGRSPRISGTDGRKMSKSYGNVISPMDDYETLVAKTKKMVTDTTRQGANAPGNPDNCSIYDLQWVYDEETPITIGQECRAGKLSCKECKETLPKKMFEIYRSFRETKESLSDEFVLDVLTEGSKNAKLTASQTMAEVREVMLMDYLKRL